MGITPRENLLRNFRSDNPEWIPVCPDLFPNQNPTKGIPSELRDVLLSSSGRGLTADILKLGEYLGADEYMIPVESPAVLRSADCPERTEKIGADQEMSILSTPRGDLRQLRRTPADAPSLVTERYVKNADDVRKLISYFESMHVVVSPEAQERAHVTKAALGDRGIIFCRTNGTPLGMCYRVFSDLTRLIYLIADEPVLLGDLFSCMEEKYLQLLDRMLTGSPEIDAYFGMDDTSTTVISPAMFETHNVELTNKRADLCHHYGKLYVHHSCGLIHDLLPEYRKTRMDGIDAFTPPPIGDVGYAEGRELLGGGYSIRTGLSTGLESMDLVAIKSHVAERFKDATEAGSVAFHVGGAHLTFPAMEMMFAEAQALKSQSA